jgi:hypothetical protein
MSQLEVDKVIPQSGTTLTLGESGDTITIANGATFTPTLTAPIIDEINDNNGNEEIIFTTTTSAVNELTIANAATGNAPEIAATGDDTDIDLKLTPKGAGNLVLDGIEFPNADGSASQVLQTNGSGVLSFATPSVGLNLIKEINASNVASVSFIDGTDSVVFDSTYKVYFVTYTNILMASDEELFLRILSGGVVQSGATDYWSGNFGTIGSPAVPGAYNDRYENALWGSPGDVESTIPVSGFAYFYNVGQSSAYPMAMGQIFMQRSNGNHYAMGFGGYYKTVISNFDGITLTNAGGGNISSGNFKLYGIA